MLQKLVLKTLPYKNFGLKKLGVLTDQQRCYFRRLSEVSYSIAKRGHQYVPFVDVIKMEKLHAVDFSSNNSYENESVCRGFTEIKSKIKQCGFISIMCNWFSSHWGRGYICVFLSILMTLKLKHACFLYKVLILKMWMTYFLT